MDYGAILSGAVLPFMGLKESIPIGSDIGLGTAETFILAFLGSMIPAPFLMVIMYEAARKIKCLNTPGYWTTIWYGAGEVSHRGAILIAVAAIPFFTANVWIAAITAAIMHIPIKKALLLIAIGDIIAGLIIIL